MLALIVLGFVLVVVPLYLWRRPRTVPETHAEPESSEVPMQASDASVASADAGVVLVRLSDPIVTQCMDPGPKRTSPEQCGHLPSFEKAFARAIEVSSSCVPSTSRPSSIVYLADVSYARKTHPIQLTLPKEGRAIKNAKVASACESSVENALKSAGLDAEHGHQRYKIQITATYP